MDDHEQCVSGPLCGYWEPWEGQEDAPFCRHQSRYAILTDQAPRTTDGSSDLCPAQPKEQSTMWPIIPFIVPVICVAGILLIMLTQWFGFRPW